MLQDLRFNPQLRQLQIDEVNGDFMTVSGQFLYDQNGFIMLGTSVISLSDPTFGRNLQPSIGTANKDLPLQIWRNMMGDDGASNATISFDTESNEQITLRATYPEIFATTEPNNSQSFITNTEITYYTVLEGQSILDVAINATGVPSIENIRAILIANDLDSLTPILLNGKVLAIPTTCSINSNVINKMKNNYQNYPVIDTNFCNKTVLEGFITDLINSLP